MPRQKPPEHQAHQRDPLKSKRAKSRPSKPPKPQPKPKPGNRTDKIRLIRGQPKGPSAKTPEQAQPKPDPPPAYPFQINNVKQPARAGPAQADAAERSAPLHSLRRSRLRSEEHTSELQSLMRISYAVLYLKKKKET